MERQLISTGTPWENQSGYSRAVRVGPFIYISGTTATDADGVVHHEGNLYGQARYILCKIGTALQSCGAELTHVVRTRIYITDMQQSSQVIQAHHEFFALIRPANTLVEVSALATPEMMVEIEVDAVVNA